MNREPKCKCKCPLWPTVALCSRYWVVFISQTLLRCAVKDVSLFRATTTENFQSQVAVAAGSKCPHAPVQDHAASFPSSVFL